MVELAKLNLSDALAWTLTRETIRRYVERPDGFELAEFVGGVLETFGLTVQAYIMSHPKAGDFRASDGPLGMGHLKIRGRVVRGREEADSRDLEGLAEELEGEEQGILVAWNGFSAGAGSGIYPASIRVFTGDDIMAMV